MTAEDFFSKAEKKWLHKVYEYIRVLFIKSPLPSHDELHHLRVWNYAKHLLTELYKSGIPLSDTDTESLLLASLFHDTGLSITPEKDHGIVSGEIFREFFENCTIKPAKYDEILFAIEKHDDKTYHKHHTLVEDNKINLLTAIGISDDLDAFGTLGIYRYLEIYLMRSIPIEDLGLKVRANLSGRYKHFFANCKDYHEFTDYHKNRFLTTDEFFKKYNNDLRILENIHENNSSAHVKIARLVYRENIKGAKRLKDICDKIMSSEKDPFINQFFQKVSDENESVHFKGIKPDQNNEFF